MLSRDNYHADAQAQRESRRVDFLGDGGAVMAERDRLQAVLRTPLPSG